MSYEIDLAKRKSQTRGKPDDEYLLRQEYGPAEKKSKLKMFWRWTTDFRNVENFFRKLRRLF